MLSDIRQNVIMLNALVPSLIPSVMIDFIMLDVLILSIIMLNVAAPSLLVHKKYSHRGTPLEGRGSTKPLWRN
jgi:hypothetical protein